MTEREVAAPTVISTFAGCGGSSLGYSMAGYREKLAVEIDGNAAATFRLNFPAVPVYEGDIAELSVKECLKLTGLKAGQLDVLDGSPPCQGFSTAGRRVLDDPRNQLFREFVRLLRGLKPKVFVMENVGGMVKGKMKLAFAEILRELKGSGYGVSARLLNAAYFQVPQARERMIFVGVRKDLGVQPSHPRAQFLPITASDALGGVLVDSKEIGWLLEQGLQRASFREWARVPMGKTLADVGGKSKAGKSSGFSARKFRPDRPAYTVTKNDGSIGLHGAMHWSERRRFTVAEFKRFASFPDQFRFAGEWKDAVARIGNSVPPFLMRAIAGHIRTEILASC